MVLYLSIIFIGMVIVSLLNIFLALDYLQTNAGIVVLVVLAGVAFVFLIDGLCAIVVHNLPDKWFGKDRKISYVSGLEKRMHRFFQVKKWKDYVWEIGALGGFSKKSLENPKDKEYVERFIIENNKGVIVHDCGMIFGFLVMIILPLKFALTISLPIALVNVLLNTMSNMVLRYNTPKLMTLYKSLARKESRQNQDA
ncbi:MAG: hypothetical protein IJS68_00270 [Clostridia bacterium]|nr:hypothetical protein [Clostridia bacterium]